MIGNAGAVVTNGLGVFIGDQNHLPTLGYGTGAAPVVIPPPTVTVRGAGAPVPTWREVISEIHKRRLAEKQVVKKEKELAKVKKKIESTYKKVEKSKHPEGILANLWKLEEEKQEIRSQVQALKAEVSDLSYWLAVKESMIDPEEDEADIEMLLLH